MVWPAAPERPKVGGAIRPVPVRDNRSSKMLIFWRLAALLALERKEPLNFFVYALTRICLLRYIKNVESVFEIIAEPNRRAILSTLAAAQQSVGEIERELGMPQPAVSKHLRVLREAGFVESTVDAQRRLYRLKPEPLKEVEDWLAQFRRFWSAHVDALERHLDRMERKAKRATQKKSGTKARRGDDRRKGGGK
jgi:DNA-binding transcriptional ArsR family regulator